MRWKENEKSRREACLRPGRVDNGPEGRKRGVVATVEQLIQGAVRARSKAGRAQAEYG